MRTLVLAAVIGVSLASSGGGQRSGLTGLVRSGPLHPVCRVGVPCNGPASGVVLTFRHGSIARRARTDATGRYRILLAPGRYVVTFSAVAFRASVRVVHVPRGRIGIVDFVLDTGIR